ncbi:MAG: pyruvate kinase, partial [Chloroflexi bacterium]|nr:pyruvate kinase [Chloroflexota bacterium]
LDAAAIVVITRSGMTAELLSRGRGHVPIYSFTPDSSVARRLALWWGITPIHQQLATDIESNVAAMEGYLLEHTFAVQGDVVVIAGSDPFKLGVHTNSVKFHVLGQRP